MSGRRLDVFITSCLVILAATLRWNGLNWGLPEVFEEATPLRVAWEMWGWGRSDGVDLNPHFFNYPSLWINLHFLLQGVQFLVLKASGAISSSLDFEAMYLIDRTPIFLAGRMMSLIAGAATVAAIYRIGAAGIGRAAAVTVGLLLAINVYHVDQSQMITVDIPLTCLVLFGLLAAVRILEPRARGQYRAAGLFLGLAAATKYTGAFLFVPILTAHLLALPSSPSLRKSRWFCLAETVATGAVVFFIASPFVILDFHGFWADLTQERQHMQMGHFGLDEAPAIAFYFQRLGNTILGWPILVAAIGGLCLPSNRRWNFVLAVFLVAFLLPMMFWNMKVDRYLLPVLPVFLLLAGAGVDRLLKRIFSEDRPGLLRPGLTVVILILMTVPTLNQYPELWKRSRKDSRVVATEWIESHVPAGSFVISEYYGPELLGPGALISMPAEIRARLADDKGTRPVYAVQILPMFQTDPARSACYYDLEILPDADYLITSSSVRSRYERDPARFSVQLRFYRRLEENWEVLREFRPDQDAGPHLILYRNPRGDPIFGAREEINGPRPLRLPAEGVGRDEGFFYWSLGVNYQHFGHLEQALDGFRIGWRHRPLRPQVHYNLVLGITETLLGLDRAEEAMEFLDEAEQEEMDSDTRQLIQQLRLFIRSKHGT